MRFLMMLVTLLLSSCGAVQTKERKLERSITLKELNIKLSSWMSRLKFHSLSRANSGE